MTPPHSKVAQRNSLLKYGIALSIYYTSWLFLIVTRDLLNIRQPTLSLIYISAVWQVSKIPQPSRYQCQEYISPRPGILMRLTATTKSPLNALKVRPFVVAASLVIQAR